MKGNIDIIQTIFKRLSYATEIVYYEILKWLDCNMSHFTSLQFFWTIIKRYKSGELFSGKENSWEE